MSYPHSKPALSDQFKAAFEGNDGIPDFANLDTMKTHHEKHHETYVAKLNGALAGAEALHGDSVGQLLKNIESVPGGMQQNVINHGGGHANHTLFWHILKPAGNGGKGPGDRSGIGGAIKAEWGSFEAFQARFSLVAADLFGSGWVFVNVAEGSNAVEILPSPNQNCPLMDGTIPVLGIDLWEHAYYLTHKNVRPNYIASFWNYVDWQKVDQLFEAGASGDLGRHVLFQPIK